MTKTRGPRWETPEPKGVIGSYGPTVAKWAEANIGISLGRWQRHVLDATLRFDRNGDLVARTALLSTGRQNGKSVVVRALFGWLLDPEGGGRVEAFKGWSTILAAAHDAKQARIIYRGVYSDLAGVHRLTKAPPRAHGEKAIRTPVSLSQYVGISRDGLNFDTVTAEPGSARGLSAGAIAWDEMLTQRDWDMWEALSPTQSAQRSPIMILTSTAGHADSLVLRSFYDRLVRQASGDEKPDPAFYGAWWQSTDSEAGLDWEQIAQANPALGDGRLTRAAIRGEHAVLPPMSWQRERLNHFVDERVETAFSPGVWAHCRTPDPIGTMDGPFAIGVDVQPGWERATIAVAGIRPDGRIGAVVHRDITENVTAEHIIDEVHAFAGMDNVVVISYDLAAGGAAAFSRAGQEVGWPWTGRKPHEIVAASMDVTELILSGRLAVDDPLLDQQVTVTGRRPVGMDGAFRFSRSHSAGPIDAFMAMTLAAHEIAQHAAPSIYVPNSP